MERLKELEEIEVKVIELINRFETEKDQSLNDIFKQFERYFGEIFEYIAMHGRAEVRLKRLNERNRGVIKARNSISIMVSFEGEREVTKKWSEFSGGQKTVIAVCMLMALQKCEPAPLYILDEIDSALDAVYLDRIVRLIEQESQHSQYFITSFKRPMLEFPEEHCNYYLV
jgi:structural maintenance of chromosome 3 (chondroitin sulfate proteoglycan 6)